MRIASNIGTARTRDRRRLDSNGSASESLFKPSMSGGTQAPPVSLSGTASLASLGSIIAAQEMPIELDRRDEGKQRGRAGVDLLEQVRLAFTEGRVSGETITRLRQFVEERGPSTDDPRLDALLNEIDVRAAVELAKLDQAKETEPG